MVLKIEEFYKGSELMVVYTFLHGSVTKYATVPKHETEKIKTIEDLLKYI